jgi:iron(III) transport system ATP-binding protein
MIRVSVQGVTKNFGETVALKSVNLEIQPGELFFLLGPSGCGKTTLLRSLAGFYIPEIGRILFDTDDVTRLEPHKRNTGMMFQSYALWPHMTVQQNVAFGLEQRKLPRTEINDLVAKALAAVHMEAFGMRKPNQLSGGQQQRIALARALVIRPRCLLLDEPLSNLDAQLRHEMRAEIRRVCKEHQLTTIYVTHDQKEALSIADRMAVMHEGEVLQIGSPAEIYKRPHSRMVCNFIGETNFLDGKVVRSGGGLIAVDTALGMLSGVAGDPAAEFTDGQSVKVSIRPECIQLSPYPSEENGFSGKIHESVYLGEIAQYHFISDSGGLNLKVFELNPRHVGSNTREGIQAYAEPEDVVVLA